MKLEVTKLDQSPIDIHGYYVNNGAKDLPASLHVEWDACDMVQLFSNPNYHLFEFKKTLIYTLYFIHVQCSILSRIQISSLFIFYRLPKSDHCAGTPTLLRVWSSTLTHWKLSNLLTRPNIWMLSRGHRFGRPFRVERLPNVQVLISTTKKLFMLNVS